MESSGVWSIVVVPSGSLGIEVASNDYVLSLCELFQVWDVSAWYGGVGWDVCVYEVDMFVFGAGADFEGLNF